MYIHAQILNVDEIILEFLDIIFDRQNVYCLFELQLLYYLYHEILLLSALKVRLVA